MRPPVPRLLTLMGLLWTLPGLMGQKASCLSMTDLSSLSNEAFNQASLDSCSYHQLILIVGAAQQLNQDTAITRQIRADMCFSLIADEIQARNEVQPLDLEDPALIFLLQQLEAQQYYLGLSKPSDFEKLSHYISQGRWSYVAQRFMDRGYHVYAGLGLLLLIAGFLFVKKRRKKNH